MAPGEAEELEEEHLAPVDDAQVAAFEAEVERLLAEAQSDAPVAEAPSQAYNPLFIYGPAGLGKTHLLQAIGHHVQSLYGKKRIRYVSTESFMNDFVEAIRERTRMPIFKRRYRDLDVARGGA